MPKDTRALLYMAQRSDYEVPLLREFIDTNQAQLASVVEQIGRATCRPLTQATIAVWGLSFKTATDDRRRSLAVDIVAQLLDAGAQVRAYDTSVSAPASELPETVVIGADPYDACTGSEVVAVLTDWEEFTKVDLERVRETMTVARMVDARNLFDPRSLGDVGFQYVNLGNP